MKKLLLVVLLLAGCTTSTLGTPVDTNGVGGRGGLRYSHDDAHSVGCWFVVGDNSSASLSCLPDSQYKQP